MRKLIILASLIILTVVLASCTPSPNITLLSFTGNESASPLVLKPGDTAGLTGCSLEFSAATGEESFSDTAFYDAAGVMFETETENKILRTAYKTLSQTTFMYESSDTSVLTVSETGMIAAVSPGTADVTITAMWGFEEEGSSIRTLAPCIVSIPLEGITTADLDLNVGDTAVVLSEVFPLEATDVELKYWVENPFVAEADKDGNVKAIANGETAILVSAIDDINDCAYLGKSLVKVTTRPENLLLYLNDDLSDGIPKEGKEAMSEATLTVGKSVTLAAALEPYTTNIPCVINWESEDTAILTVAPSEEDLTAVVKGQKEGSTVLNVHIIAEDGTELSLSCKFKVKPAPAPAGSNVRAGMSDAEYQQAYAIAHSIASRYAGMDRASQLTGLCADLRAFTEANVTYNHTDPHYNDAYGFFVLKYASCAGATRAVGLCLNILGIPWEHVNPNKWTHQWPRINVDGTYWI